MPQSLSRLLVHLVFSTKNRIPFLQSPQLRSEVQAYLTATLRGVDCEPMQVGGVADHVHLLFGLSRTISLAELVKDLKTSSTKMMSDTFGTETRHFYRPYRAGRFFLGYLGLKPRAESFYPFGVYRRFRSGLRSSPLFQRGQKRHCLE
jgi:putative transposase